MARWVLLWLALFGVYAATLGIDAVGGSRYSAEEAHYLLAARSIVKDHDVDVTDEFAAREYREFFPRRLTPYGQRTEGRLNEPRGLGLPLLIAPAYALAGPTGVELFLGAIAALAFVLAAALARRLVPEPWATAAPAGLRALAAGAGLRDRGLARTARRRAARRGLPVPAQGPRPSAPAHRGRVRRRCSRRCPGWD